MTDTESGLRYNEGKLRYDLLPADAIEELVRVYTRGAIKYAPNNWAKGLSHMDTYASLMRHAQAWVKGEARDEETELLHMAHVAWNALTLVAFALRGAGTDDRPIKGYDLIDRHETARGAEVSPLKGIDWSTTKLEAVEDPFEWPILPRHILEAEVHTLRDRIGQLEVALTPAVSVIGLEGAIASLTPEALSQLADRLRDRVSRLKPNDD